MGTPGLVITTYSGTRECSETSTDPKNGLACTYRAIMEKDYFKNLGK
jgi:hypothetical protein